jgi:hypothetical protein
MFQQVIIDHEDNKEKLILDKDYFYQKKFQPISCLDDVKNRNNIDSITQREKNLYQNLSINEVMSL